MQAIILAGGLGTRLSHLIKDVPKPMAPIGGKPFLEVMLNYLLVQNISEVILSVGYKYEIIKNYFGSNYKGIKLYYCIEEKPMGTGGAIYASLRLVSSDFALILNGDTFFKINYEHFIKTGIENSGAMTIALKKIDDTSRYGSVTVAEDYITSLQEKTARGPGLINAGVYFISKNVFNAFNLPEKFSFEMDFLQHYITVIKPKYFISNDYFIDIGTPESYQRAQQELLC